MNVSLRSQMVAGIAALGATAVAITPIAQPDLLASAERVSTAVQLSAFDNPIAAVLDVVSFVNEDIFSQGFWTDDEAFWPEEFFGAETGFLYAPLNVGIIPDIANQFSTGPLVGLVNNLSGYVGAVITSALALGGGALTSVTNIPFAVVSAAQELIAGDAEAALETLIAQIITPIQSGIDTALAGIGYIVDNVIENIEIVTSSFLPYLVVGVFDSITQGATVIGEALITTVTTAFQELAAGNFEGAWNTAVQGLLGGDGTLGLLEAMTFSIGILGVDGEDVFLDVPSPRSVITSELQRLGGAKSWEEGGITNDAFEPPVGASSAATPAAAEVAPSVAALVSTAPADTGSDAAKATEVDAPEAPAAPAADEAAPEAPAGDAAPAADEAAPAVDDSAGTASESNSKPVQRAPRAGKADKADKADRSERVGRSAR